MRSRLLPLRPDGLVSYGISPPLTRGPVRMDPTPIESRRRTSPRSLLGGGSVSLVIHAAIVGAAVYATLGAVRADSAGTVDTTAVFLQPPDEASRPPALDVPLLGFQTITVPTSIPVDIPAIDLQQHFDPKDYSGVGVEGGRAGGAMPAGGAVYAEADVDEPPILLAGPPPPYPELMRRAGIQGRVVLQFVIDTTGRAEPGSVKILTSPNPAFVIPVRQWIQRVQFRPARVRAHAQRVLVNFPVLYSLNDG